jgi:HEAT repeat protein
LVLVGLIVAGVWAWKRLPIETQDLVVERAIPLGAVGVAIALVVWIGIRRLGRRRRRVAERARLIARFEKEASPPARQDLAFTLVELNEYRLEGLERVASALREVFASTLTTALGDKQHRIRGMAASYLGVLQDKSVIPLLLAALEDDHAYVRSCAALALGRMRASEAKAKLAHVMEEDWDQTVRSRAREALERIS